jgi:hypothetical protein
MGVPLGRGANIPGLVVYLGFVLDDRRNRPVLRGVASIRIVLLLAFAFGCVEVFNPNSPSVLVGFNGLKTYFLYSPIAFILPYAFKSARAPVSYD